MVNIVVKLERNHLSVTMFRLFNLAVQHQILRERRGGWPLALRLHRRPTIDVAHQRLRRELQQGAQEHRQEQNQGVAGNHRDKQGTVVRHAHRIASQRNPSAPSPEDEAVGEVDAVDHGVEEGEELQRKEGLYPGGELHYSLQADGEDQER